MSNESTWFKSKCTPFSSCFGNYRRLAYKILAYEVCIICPKLFVACKIHCKSPSRRPDGLTTLDWFTVNEANLSAYGGESAYVRSRVGCGRVHQTLLLHVPQIFERLKSDANKQDFEIKLNLTYRARSNPKITGILTKVFCTFGPNHRMTGQYFSIFCGQHRSICVWYIDSRVNGCILHCVLSADIILKYCVLSKRLIFWILHVQNCNAYNLSNNKTCGFCYDDFLNSSWFCCYIASNLCIIDCSSQ